MKGLAFNSMRYGQRYHLLNFGENYEFEVIDIQDRDEFKLRDIHTLEIFYMSDLIRFGKGEDFEIREI